MALEDNQKNYLFPRIPLTLILPDNYPDAGGISNISVIPKIGDYRLGQDELEIIGSYRINVSYFKGNSAAEKPPAAAELKYDQFFSALKVQENGLFAEDEDPPASPEVPAGKELYTVSFSKSFHTYVDRQEINPPRSFKPVMVVDKINLWPEGGRVLKGELLLELVNRSRRSNR